MTNARQLPKAISMTGYARTWASTPEGRFELELRSVNSRFLDLTLKMADAWRPLENAIRERVQSAVKRGKLELRVSTGDTAEAAPMQLDEGALRRLAELQRQVCAHFATASTLTVHQVLNWPGVQPMASVDEADELIVGKKLDAIAQLLAEHAEFRAREGAAMAALILERVDSARSLVVQVEPIVSRITAQFGERLKAKIAQANLSVDAERLAQEIVLNAQRLDISEECGRLHAHLDAVVQNLCDNKAASPVGKKLDFLMQELNREANTLGSKSGDIETTRIAVELKVLFEQMREQVQNLE